MISNKEIIELIQEAEESPTLDYKEDLHLETDADKAEFVKDVLALANSGELAHLIVGVEDGTGKPVGLKTSHTVEQLNQILKDKCDPPISVEYIEKDILKYKIGVIEFKGENPPYIVSVTDKFGGPLSSDSKKFFFIHRGTIFVRNYNMNEGARRADVDKMYKVKYVTLQSDLHLSHESSVEKLKDTTKVTLKFFLRNSGEVVSYSSYIWIQFNNIEKILERKGEWTDISHYNNDIPTAQFLATIPVIPEVRFHAGELVVEVRNEVDSMEADLILAAPNMRTKRGPYIINLKKGGKNSSVSPTKKEQSIKIMEVKEI